MRDRFINRFGDVGRHALGKKFARQTDTLAGQRPLQITRVILTVTLQAGRIARIKTGHDIKHQAEIFSGARKRTGLIKAGRKRDHAVTRNHAVGRFKSANACQRGGLANRTSGVGTGGHRGETRGNRRRRTTRAAARHGIEIPRVAHRTEERGFVRRAHRKLVHIGLAGGHRSRCIELLDDVGVVGRAKISEHF